jgi:hypothetical protein
MLILATIRYNFNFSLTWDRLASQCQSCHKLSLLFMRLEDKGRRLIGGIWVSVSGCLSGLLGSLRGLSWIVGGGRCCSCNRKRKKMGYKTKLKSLSV